MGAATGESLPRTVERAITWIFPEPGRKRLLRLLASGETSGWTGGPERLSLTFQCTTRTLTCSVWSGVYRGLVAILCVGSNLHSHFWKRTRETLLAAG